eukprot:745652-Hanusia_phi.AAC.7
MGRAGGGAEGQAIALIMHVELREVVAGSGCHSGESLQPGDHRQRDRRWLYSRRGADGVSMLLTRSWEWAGPARLGHPEEHRYPRRSLPKHPVQLLAGCEVRYRDGEGGVNPCQCTYLCVCLPLLALVSSRAVTPGVAAAPVKDLSTYLGGWPTAIKGCTWTMSC